MTKRTRKTWHSDDNRPRPSRRLPDPRDHPTITVERAAAILGISRGVAYDAVRNGTIPSLRVGRRLLVPTALLTSLLGIDLFSRGDANCPQPSTSDSAKTRSLPGVASVEA